MKNKKFKTSKFDQEKTHHEVKQKKNIFVNKNIKVLDKVLKSKNYNKILSIDEAY